MITVSAASLTEVSRSLSAQLTQLEKVSSLEVSLNGTTIELTQLDQPLMAATSFSSADLIYTKWDILRYYAMVAPAFLPLIKNRPLLSWSQFQKHVQELDYELEVASTPPVFLDTVEMYSEVSNDNEPFILCQSLDGLLWLIEHGMISFSPWHSRINADQSGLPTIFINSVGTLNMSVANYPDSMVFNLQFVNDATTQLESDHQRDTTRLAAQILHNYLESVGLPAYLKTNGRGGLHIFVPIERHYHFAKVQEACLKISEDLIQINPDIFRKGWKIDEQDAGVVVESCNIRSKPVLAAYSINTPNGYVSLPLEWKDLDRYEHDFTIYDFIKGVDFEHEYNATAASPISKKGTVKRPWLHLYSSPQELSESIR